VCVYTCAFCVPVRDITEGALTYNDLPKTLPAWEALQSRQSNNTPPGHFFLICCRCHGFIVQAQL